VGTFYLGTPNPAWLRRIDIPLCVSRRRLARYVTLPRACGPWILDSGGFTELSRHGRWTITADEYAAFVLRCAEEVGHLQWAAPMDFMCEPAILAETGHSVAAHQGFTVGNFLWLREQLGELVIPVLQGYGPRDYERCFDLYARAGIDLTAEPVVGIGSVCRRSGTLEANRLIRYVSDFGVQLHAFGIKGATWRACRGLLASADSQAWSMRARRSGVPSFSMPFALEWRDRLLACAA